jgi:hypothetical protein
MSLLAMDLRASIRSVAIKHPQLRAYGYRLADVADDDANKFGEPDDEFVGQVLRALEWLKDVPKTARFNRGSTSYGYKHQAEHWHRASGSGQDCYISNGAFIVAALIAGFKVKRCGGFDSPNAYFNMGERKTKPSAPAPVTEPNRSFIRRLQPVAVRS